MLSNNMFGRVDMGSDYKQRTVAELDLNLMTYLNFSLLAFSFDVSILQLLLPRDERLGGPHVQLAGVKPELV